MKSKPPEIPHDELARLQRETRRAQVCFVERRLGIKRAQPADTRAAKLEGPARNYHDHMRAMQRRMICFLKMEGARPLSDPIHKEILAFAAENDDREFFKILGRTLESKPKRGVVFTRLELFLFDHWAEPRDGLPPLATLQDLALAEVAKHFAGDSVGDSAPRMARKLGLPRYKGRRRMAIVIGGKVKFSD